MKPTYQELQKEIENLNEKLNYFKSIIKNSAENILVFNKQGKIMFLNISKHTLGYSEEERNGGNIFDIILPTDKEGLMNRFNEFLPKLDCEENVSFRAVHKNKSLRYFEGTFINKLNSTLNGVILNYRDVTAKVEAQKELLKSKEKAEESNRLKTAFLANMSHEIRTPMNSILGFSKFLRDETLDKKTRIQYLNYINTSGNHLLEFINDIIDLSKIDANILNVVETECELNSFLKEIYQIFKHRISKEDKQLVIKYTNGLWDGLDFIKVDVTRLRQILINLISNAEKFTKSGVIEIEYSVIDGSMLKFSITDTGIGITEKDLPIIFDRFRQADISSTREFGGSGLGLSISKSYAKLLGGDLWVESEIGEGSTFYFTIAYKPIRGKKSKIEKNEIENFNLKGKNILIVEDDPYNAMILEKILTDLDASIFLACDGQEAIDMCRNNDEIDIVLMDVQMPILDGLKATTEILKFRPNLPIISQTANAMEDDKLKSLEVGCVDYLSKPIVSEELIEKLHKYLTS